MSSLTARVVLQYRPAADVLTGRIDLGIPTDDATAVTEQPDADTTMVWVPIAGGPVPAGEYLTSFQIVFAAARLHHGALPLPPSLVRTAEALIDTATQALNDVSDPLARVRARAEATGTVPVSDLQRGLPAAPLLAHRQAIERRTTARLSRSLAQVADAVQQRVPAHDEAEALHTDHLARLLRELSTTIDEQPGRTAPGTTAATRAAAHDVVTLSDDELDALEQVLDDLDHPDAWPAADQSLEWLLHVLERSTP